MSKLPQTLSLQDAEALAASFLEARRPLHGDLRMEDTGGDPGGSGGDPGQSGGDPGAGGNGGGDPAGGNPAGGETPPWERDGQSFDPARAWNLIQSLRGENGTVKAERDQYKGKVTDAERAAMTDLQRAQTERDEALQASTTTAGELARVRAAMKYGLTEEDLDFLSGVKPDEVDGRAAALAQRLGIEAPGGGQRPPTNRPTENLRGGGDPTNQTQAVDVAKLIADIPRSF